LNGFPHGLYSSAFLGDATLLSNCFPIFTFVYLPVLLYGVFLALNITYIDAHDGHLMGRTSSAQSVAGNKEIPTKDIQQL
jgi:hypothetical protein